MTKTPKLFSALMLALLFASCGSSKITHGKNKENNLKSLETLPPASPLTENKVHTAPEGTSPEDSRVFDILSYALDFRGTRYKYGGTTKKGIDCSGLIYTAYLHNDIPLPRTSRAMSLTGDRLSLNEVNIGDLLFFQTNKNKKVINHVGLVVQIKPGEIYFIHATTSRGVIISSLTENYWYQHFVMARRVI